MKMRNFVMLGVAFASTIVVTNSIVASVCDAAAEEASVNKTMIPAEVSMIERLAPAIHTTLNDYMTDTQPAKTEPITVEVIKTETTTETQTAPISKLDIESAMDQEVSLDLEIEHIENTYADVVNVANAMESYGSVDLELVPAEDTYSDVTNVADALESYGSIDLELVPVEDTNTDETNITDALESYGSIELDIVPEIHCDERFNAEATEYLGDGYTFWSPITNCLQPITNIDAMTEQQKEFYQNRYNVTGHDDVDVDEDFEITEIEAPTGYEPTLAPAIMQMGDWTFTYSEEYAVIATRMQGSLEQKVIVDHQGMMTMTAVDTASDFPGAISMAQGHCELDNLSITMNEEDFSITVDEETMHF